MWKREIGEQLDGSGRRGREADCTFMALEGGLTRGEIVVGEDRRSFGNWISPAVSAKCKTSNFRRMQNLCSFSKMQNL